MDADGILRRPHSGAAFHPFFVANLTLCSLITPDTITTFIMMIPVQMLIELCVLISKRWERKDRLAEQRRRQSLLLFGSVMGHLAEALAIREVIGQGRRRETNCLRDTNPMLG